MMKKILLLISFLIAATVIFAQPVFVPRSSAALTAADARLKALLNFYYPRTHGLTLNGGLDSLGAVIYEDSSRHVWYRDTIPTGGHKWTMILNSSDGQSAIQFQNQGTNVGTVGQALVYNFIGSGVTAGVSGNKATITITGPDTSKGIISINGDTSVNALFLTGYAGTSPNIVTSHGVTTWNTPIVNTLDTGLVTPALYNTWNGKQNALTFGNVTTSNLSVTGGAGSVIGSGLTVNLPAILASGTCTNCTLGLDAFGRVLSYSSGSSSSGTLTTVGLTMPSFLSVANSPLTGTGGTINVTLANQAAYNILINNTGSPAQPVFAAPNSTILNTWFGGTIQGAISLTTTGASGSATFSSNTLNIPTYTLAGLGGITLTNLSMTTTGTSGAATYNNSTGVFNIPQYQGAITLTTIGTSGAATFSGNILNIPQYGSGSGSTNLNIGSGFRLAVPSTNNIKTLFAGIGMKLDSTSNTNGITISVDTSVKDTVFLTNTGSGATLGSVTNGTTINIKKLIAGTNFTIDSVTTVGSLILNSTGGGANVIDTTIAGIRAFTTASASIFYYTKDIGQQGVWYYNSSDVSSADNTGTILVDASGHRFYRVFQDAVNVKWFGAKGDGTTDEQVAINAAVAYAIPNRFNIYFPTGTYALKTFVGTSNNVFIDFPTGSSGNPYKVRIYGDQGATITTSVDSNGIINGARIFRINNAYQDCIVENIFFQNTHALIGYQTNAIALAGSNSNLLKHFTIRNCRFEGFSTAIVSVGTDNLVVENNRFAAPLGHDNAQNNTQPANFIWLFSNASGLSINSDINHNFADGYTGTDITTTATRAPMDNFVYGNPVGGTVAYNTLKHLGTEFITVQSYTTAIIDVPTVISNNWIDATIVPNAWYIGTSTLQTQVTAIRSQALNSVISNNTIHNATTGITQIANGVTNYPFTKWLIENNNITMTDSTGNAYEPIVINGFSGTPVHNVTIKGNTVNYKNDSLKQANYVFTIANADSTLVADNVVNIYNPTKQGFGLTLYNQTNATGTLLKGNKYLGKTLIDTFYKESSSTHIVLDSLIAGANITLTGDGITAPYTIASSGGGSGITALTGDGTASGTGSVAFTLATVNSNVGTFGGAATIPVFTVNGKGLITGVTNTVIAGLTNANLSGSAGITNANLANSTISGISLGSNLNSLTIGTGLSGTTYNGSAAVTIANTGVLSFSGGTTGFTPNTATNGAITLAGTLATTNGGTGLTSFTTSGLFYASSSSAISQISAPAHSGMKLTATSTSTFAWQDTTAGGGGSVTAGLGINVSGSTVSNQLGYYYPFSTTEPRMRLADYRRYDSTQHYGVIFGTSKMMLADTTGNFNSVYLLFQKGIGGSGAVNPGTGSAMKELYFVGPAGSREFNTSVNMNYDNGSTHLGYDSTQDAVWSYLSAFGTGVQGAAAGHYNNQSDIWTQTNRQVPFEVDFIKDGTGNYIKGHNQLFTSLLTIRDYTDTTKADGTFKLSGTNLNIAGGATTISHGFLQVASDDATFVSDALKVVTIKDVLHKTTLGIYNDINVGNSLYMQATNAGSFTVATNSNMGEWNVNTIGFAKFTASADHPSTFTSPDFRLSLQGTTTNISEIFTVLHTQKVGIIKPVPTANLNIASGSTVAGGAALKIDAINVATTAISSTGTIVTITVATSGLPFYIGETITVAGVTPSGYNGSYVITSFTSNSVTFASTTTGAQTVAGTVSSGLLATPEAGAIENNATHLFYTDNSLNRWQLDQQTLQQTITASGTLTGTDNITGGGTATLNFNSFAALSIASSQTTIQNQFYLSNNTNTLDYQIDGNTTTGALEFGYAGKNFGTTKGLALSLDSNNNAIAKQGFAFSGWNTITAGSSSTIPLGFVNILFNPATLIATYTLTLPAAPVDGQLIKIHGGGAIAGGATVVTALTISPNSGQTIEQSAAPTTLVGGSCIIYQYNAATSIWYREQ